MTSPILPNDANSRGLRTLLQSGLVDIVLAVIVIVLPLLQAASINWQIVLASLAKTALVAGVSWLQRTLETSRSQT
jgi:hypothetical protein